MTKKKLIISKQTDKSYQELFEDYMKVCKIRNLSSVTIRTYYNHHNYFIRFIGKELICSEINQSVIDEYKLHLMENQLSSVSINSYIKNIRPVIKYGIELAILLKKPNMKKCSFAEFRNWVIINFLLGTGVRAKELRNIKIKDIDLDNDLISLQVTKNRKARYIPIPHKVLTEYIALRQAKCDEEYLFCTQYGDMMQRTTLQLGITKYCKKRGLNKYSLHLFRHAYASYYIKNGNPFVLQRILGHQSMKMVNHYLQMNTKDLQENIALHNPLEQFSKNRINVK